MKDNLELYMAVGVQNSRALQDASEWMRGNREFCMADVTQDGLILEFVSAEMKGDRELCTVAITQNGLALKFASDEMKGDRELCMAAVTLDGLAIKFVSEELKGNRELCMAAVTKNGLALEFVSEDLKGDRELCMAAVAECGSALKFANEAMKFDATIVTASVNSWPTRYYYLNAHLKLAPADEKSIRDAAVDLLEASCIQFSDDGPFPHLTFTTSFFTYDVFVAVSSLVQKPILLHVAGVRIVRNRWVFLDIAKDATTANVFDVFSELLSSHLYPKWGYFASYENWEPHITLGVLPTDATAEQIDHVKNKLETWRQFRPMHTVNGKLGLGEVGDFGTVIKQY